MQKFMIYEDHFFTILPNILTKYILSSLSIEF